jgi:hypothetical protein
VVVSGSSYSNAIRLFDDATALTIYSPATLTGVITVETEPTDTGTSFVTLQSGGTDVTLPAGKATVLNKVGWRQMRLASAATEAGARTFSVRKSVNV